MFMALANLWINMADDGFNRAGYTIRLYLRAAQIKTWFGCRSVSMALISAPLSTNDVNSISSLPLRNMTGIAGRLYVVPLGLNDARYLNVIAMVSQKHALSREHL